MKVMVECWGLQFKGLAIETALEVPGNFRQIVTVNAEMVVTAHKDDRLREIVNHTDTLSTIDGQHTLVLARSATGGQSIEKVSGSDIIYKFAKRCFEKDYRLFLLGAIQEVNDTAVKNLRKEFGVDVRGYSPPYEQYPFSRNTNDDILRRLQEFKPHVLFVAFGALKQELWIYSNKARLSEMGVKVAVGCGGSLDFVSGRVRRAPKSIQNFGLEGVWRLVQEPKLFRLRRVLYSTRLYWIHLKYVVTRSRRR